ncbi:MAG TPA: hypothetical protein VGO96_14710 [Pyrinomonadaceae bacterium]|nr:hypothetical protein [Pyrinomonadaceae bacterium]
MSAKEQDPVRSLAERIASRLAQDGGRESPASPEGRDAVAANVGDELAALRAGLSEIGQRLTQIESHVTTNAPRQTERAARQHEHQHEHHAPNQQATPDAHARQHDRATAQTNSNPSHWLSGTYVPAVHPSEERFGIDEAVSELVEFFEREKVCNVEPGGKPCDHCGMCSSRGF